MLAKIAVVEAAAAKNQKSKNDILNLAVPLFARGGYTGVSMRQIAEEVGLNAASLYHHFPDKQTLYIEAVKQAFLASELDLSKILKMKVAPRKRLSLLIKSLCKYFQDRPDLRRLMQRELLDGDETRLQLMVTYIFRSSFEAVTSLSKELSSELDPHLLAISIFALTSYHYQTAVIRAYLPGFKPNHNNPAILADHIVRLLLNSL